MRRAWVHPPRATHDEQEAETRGDLGAHLSWVHFLPGCTSQLGALSHSNVSKFRLLVASQRLEQISCWIQPRRVGLLLDDQIRHILYVGLVVQSQHHVFQSTLKIGGAGSAFKKLLEHG